MTPSRQDPEPDPRLTPYRPDLAARHLEGTVKAGRYADGVPHRVIAPVAPLRAAPEATAGLSTELLFGEDFTVYERRNGWAWGQAAFDGYVGYTPESALGAPGPEPSHAVSVLSAPVLPSPDLKQSPAFALPLNARVVVHAEDGMFMGIGGIGGIGGIKSENGGGWIASADLAPVGGHEPDYTATAALFMGVPYLWGGRTALGLDCSALVQMALQRAGVRAPRDSDLQAASLGSPVADDAGALKRGDLVFCPGHVGIMEDAETLLHANARDMAVSRHALDEFVTYIKEQEGAVITGVRRL